MRYRHMKPNKTVFRIICLLLIVLTVFLLLDAAVRPQVRKVAVIQAQSFAALTAGKKIPAILEDIFADDGGLVRVTRDEEGNILSIQSDAKKLNMLKSAINSSVSAALSGMVSSETAIPLGNLTGLSLLNGRGPKVNAVISITGSAHTDFEDSFESAGINQTIHRIYLKTTLDMLLVLPGETLITAYTYTQLASETVIVGRIPSFYGNITQK